ncbi:hypothetical protein IAE22_31470, partial [Bacillus sp. S34]|nr:hypothetical protein [Bacillus sp. S34]
EGSVSAGTGPPGRQVCARTTSARGAPCAPVVRARGLRLRVVDEQVFSADKLTPAADIVKGKAFAGQYSISSYKENDTIQYKANKNYDGLLGKPKTDEVTASYYTKETDLKLAVQKGDVDVAYRSRTASSRRPPMPTLWRDGSTRT